MGSAAPTTQRWLPVRRQHRGLGKRSLPGFLPALHEASLFWDLQSSPTGPEGRMGIILDGILVNQTTLTPLTLVPKVSTPKPSKLNAFKARLL